MGWYNVLSQRVSGKPDRLSADFAFLHIETVLFDFKSICHHDKLMELSCLSLLTYWNRTI